MSSIQTGSLLQTSYLPLKEIRRPIVPVLDQDKIAKMIDTVKHEQELPPVDILHVRRRGKSYYFAFGGCHRLQAYDRLGLDEIPVKKVPTTERQLKLYLGATDVFGEDE